MRRGALTLTPRITLGQLGIDTNVENSYGERKSDLTFTVGPQLNVAFKTPRFLLETLTQAPVTFYKTYRDQGGLNPGVTVHGEYRANPRLSFATFDSFQFVRDRPSVEVDTRSRRLQSDVAVGVNIGLTPKVSLGISRDERRTAYDAAALFQGVQLQQTLNQSTTQMTETLMYRMTPYTTVRAGVSQGRDRFPNSVDRNIDSNGVSLGVQFNQRALLSGDAAVGYGFSNSLSPTVPDFKGTTVNGRLMSSVRDSLGLMVHMYRDIGASAEVTHPYYVQNTYEAAAQQGLGRRFDVGIVYSYTDLGYRNFLPAPVGVAPVREVATGTRDDVIRAYSVSLGFLTRRLGRYAVYVTDWQRRSNQDPLANYDGLRVGFMLTSSRWLNATSDGDITTNTRWLNASSSRGIFIPGLGL